MPCPSSESGTQKALMSGCPRSPQRCVVVHVARWDADTLAVLHSLIVGRVGPPPDTDRSEMLMASRGRTWVRR